MPHLISYTGVTSSNGWPFGSSFDFNFGAFIISNTSALLLHHSLVVRITANIAEQ